MPHPHPHPLGSWPPPAAPEPLGPSPFPCPPALPPASQQALQLLRPPPSLKIHSRARFIKCRDRGVRSRFPAEGEGRGRMKPSPGSPSSMTNASLRGVPSNSALTMPETMVCLLPAPSTLHRGPPPAGLPAQHLWGQPSFPATTLALSSGTPTGTIPAHSREQHSSCPRLSPSVPPMDQRMLLSSSCLLRSFPLESKGCAPREWLSPHGSQAALDKQLQTQAPPPTLHRQDAAGSAI